MEYSGPDKAGLPETLRSRRAHIRSPLVQIALANVGYAQATYLSLLIILPARAASIGGHTHKTVLLALVAAAGAIIALPTGIVAGLVSDRLLDSHGSRRSVIAIGAVTCAALLAVLPFTRSAASLLIAWCGVQIGLNVVYTIITTSLLDWFATDHRGRASAYAGTGQVTGALLASGLVFAVGGYPTTLGAVSGVIALAAALPAMLGRHPAKAPLSGELPPSTSPARGHYRDVRLAFAVRAVVTFANTLVFTFANYYVSDVLHLRDPQRFVGLAAGEMSVLVLAGALCSGWASDRSGRRRWYVVGAVLFMCAGEVLLATWQSVPGVLTACAFVGFGYGVYLSIDQALTADVLPDPRCFGRDVGIMNAAVSAPQVGAPALGTLLLSVSPTYSVLFSVGALITLSGVAFVLPIRSVR